MNGMVETDREQFSEIMIQKYKSEYAFQICFTIFILVCKTSKCTEIV